jgi:hypothetical protein
MIKDNDLLNSMYKRASQLVHSNNILLTDPKFKDIIKMNLCYCIENLAVYLLTKCFYDLFMDKNYFDSNVFLKICEYSMKNYNIEIWGIR